MLAMFLSSNALSRSPAIILTNQPTIHKLNRILHDKDLEKASVTTN